LTGGAGFIGSHLAEALLRRGSHLTIVDSLDNFYSPSWKQANLEAIEKTGAYDFYPVDICDREALAKVMEGAQPDVVIHLAARAGVRPSIEQPSLYEQVNIAGLRLARQDWARYRTSLGSKPIVVGQTARPHFPAHEGRASRTAQETVLDAARMRAMLDVVLQLGDGDAGPGPAELAFWSDDLLFLNPAERRELVHHLGEAARGSGLRRDNVGG